jgi:hypothetical protein
MGGLDSLGFQKKLENLVGKAHTKLSEILLEEVKFSPDGLSNCLSFFQKISNNI